MKKLMLGENDGASLWAYGRGTVLILIAVWWWAPLYEATGFSSVVRARTSVA